MKSTPPDYPGFVSKGCVGLILNSGTIFCQIALNSFLDGAISAYCGRRNFLAVRQNCGMEGRVEICCNGVFWMLVRCLMVVSVAGALFSVSERKEKRRLFFLFRGCLHKLLFLFQPKKNW